MKTKVLAIIIAAVLLIGAGTGIGFAIYGNLPQNAAATAIFGAIEDFGERDEIQPLLKMLTKGSFEFSLNELKEGDEDILEDGKFSGKMYFSKDAFMLENLEFNAGDFAIAGDIYISEDLLYISEDELLKNAYGIELKKIVEDFEDSIFAYGSDSEYAIPDEETHNDIVSALSAAQDTKMQKEAQKIAEKLYKKMWKIACDNFEFESENEEIKVGGSKEKVRVITIIIEGDALAEAISEFYDYLCEDKSIPKFLDKYEDALDFTFTSTADDKTIAELYEEYLDQLGDNMSDICDSIERNFSDDIVIKVATPKSSKKLVKLEVEANGENVFTLDLGMKGIRKTDKITLEIDGEKLTYQVKTDNSKEFECVLKNDTTTVKLNVDKKKDKFTFSVDSPNSSSLKSLEIKGDWETKSGKTTITVDKIESVTYGYDKYYNRIEITNTIDCDIVFVIDQSDKIPSAPKDYKRISDITEEDIEDWVETFGNIA